MIKKLWKHIKHLYWRMFIKKKDVTKTYIYLPKKVQRPKLTQIARMKRFSDPARKFTPVPTIQV